jgi:hypothetical protein
MFKWLSQAFGEKRRKEQHERMLRRALSEKIARYEIKAKNDQTNFTLVEVDGRKMLVHKEKGAVEGKTAYST